MVEVGTRAIVLARRKTIASALFVAAMDHSVI
jgi:hypothetical protein